MYISCCSSKERQPLTGMIFSQPPSSFMSRERAWAASRSRRMWGKEGRTGVKFCRTFMV